MKMRPRLMTLKQIYDKYPVWIKDTVLAPAIRMAWNIPGMLVHNPEEYTPEEYSGVVEVICNEIIDRYRNCIFYLPIDEDAIPDIMLEASSSILVSAWSVNAKYQNLALTIPAIENITGETMTPIEWYLTNYKVTMTGTVGIVNGGTTTVGTDISTERTRQIGSKTEGTTGETTATLRDIERTLPVGADNLTDVPKDVDHVTGKAKDNITTASTSGTTTYNTTKSGYYNTGNKTTILKDIQEMSAIAPLFPKWCDEVICSILIPVYSSTFGFKTE